MPKYYCEYCDIYLTHSSPAGRRQHNKGRKHLNNKIEYYQNLIRDPTFVPPPHIDPNAASRPFVPGVPSMGPGMGVGGLGGMMRPPQGMMPPPGMGVRPPMMMGANHLMTLMPNRGFPPMRPGMGFPGRPGMGFPPQGHMGRC